MGFWIEVPGDEFNNIGRWSGDSNAPYPVIEAEAVINPEMYEGQKMEHRLSLKVIAPEHIKAKWSTLNPRHYEKIDGPVRNLTYKEYAAIFPPGSRKGWASEVMEKIQVMIAEVKGDSE